MVVIGAVAEVLAREGVGRPLEPVGIPDRFIAPGGPFDNLAERIGLSGRESVRQSNVCSTERTEEGRASHASGASGGEIDSQEALAYTQL
jgi:hypothetical protein